MTSKVFLFTITFLHRDHNRQISMVLCLPLPLQSMQMLKKPHNQNVYVWGKVGMKYLKLSWIRCRDTNKSWFRTLWSLGAQTQGVSVYSTFQIVLCWLLFKDEGQREKGLSLVRLLRALSTASGMWSASILGLIKILLNAISLDQSAR